MIEKLDQREQYTLLGICTLLAVAAFGAGFAFAGNEATPTGMAVSDGGTTLEDTVRANVQDFMDQQMERQRQQFPQVANRSENITEDDLSITADVTNVETSQFGSLYKVTVSITGTVPGFGGGLQDIDQEQVLYTSSDGRHLFQQPTDLEQPQQGPVPPR